MKHFRSKIFIVSFLFLSLSGITFAAEGVKPAGANDPQTWKKALQDAGFTVFPEAQALPVINVPGLDGKYINIKDFSGSFVLLNFWATWCPPCKAEMVSLLSLKVL